MHTEARFTTPQAVDYLKKAGFPVSKPTLERYRAKGTGPVYLRIGKRVFYPQSALDEFLSGTPVFPTQSEPEAQAKPPKPSKINRQLKPNSWLGGLIKTIYQIVYVVKFITSFFQWFSDDMS